MRFTALIMARQLSRSHYTHYPDKSSLAIFTLLSDLIGRAREEIFVSISSRGIHDDVKPPLVRRNWRNCRASEKFKIRILFIHRGSTCTSISFRSGNRVLPRQRSSGIFKATPRTEINVSYTSVLWRTRMKIFLIYLSRGIFTINLSLRSFYILFNLNFISIEDEVKWFSYWYESTGADIKNLYRNYWCLVWDLFNLY